jgi:putative hemolysin
MATLEYTPLQCQQTPWDAWLANSSIRFIKAPTQAELIAMYYSNVYEIAVFNITQIETQGTVCMACDVCSKGYKFVASVAAADKQPLIDTGWKIRMASPDIIGTENPGATQLANPASTYCVNQGYNDVIKTNIDGSQTGYCDFGNGRQCEEWAYYRGECNITI